MNKDEIEKLNEIKALSESLSAMEKFDLEKSLNQRKQLLQAGIVIFIMAFVMAFFFDLNVASLAFVGVIAIAFIFINQAIMIGKTSFFAKYTNQYVDLERMKNRLNKLSS